MLFFSGLRTITYNELMIQLRLVNRFIVTLSNMVEIAV